MADMSIVDSVLGLPIAVIDWLLHYGIGFLILLVLGLILYLFFMKPKPIDMGKEVFLKYWEATTERLRLSSPKRLALCSYPMDTADLKENIHLLKFDIVGNIIGINIAGVMTGDESVYNLNKNINESTYKKVLDENKEAIKEGKFWFVLACETRKAGWFFPTKLKSLIWVKADQIININSSDDIIRVRGFGLIPQGWNQLINDENVNLNRKQLMLDNISIINEEVVLRTYSNLAVLIEESMRSDSLYRKEVAREGIKSYLPSRGSKEVIEDDTR